MGRYSGSGKDTVEGYKTITTKFLKQYGYFDGGFHSGGLNWTRSGEKTGSISFQVSTISGAERNPYEERIRFIYTQTDRDTREKTEFDYRVGLEATKCHYGGVRWWFLCPLCGNRRVGTLYLGSRQFACRHCYNLTYESRNEPRRGLFGVMHKLFKAEKIEEELKRRFYKGKPTKKYRRYLYLNSRLPSTEVLKELENKALQK